MQSQRSAPREKQATMAGARKTRLPASQTHGPPTVGAKGVIYAVHDDPEVRAGQEGTFRTLTPAQQREEEAHVREMSMGMLNKKEKRRPWCPAPANAPPAGSMKDMRKANPDAAQPKASGGRIVGDSGHKAATRSKKKMGKATRGSAAASRGEALDGCLTVEPLRDDLTRTLYSTTCGGGGRGGPPMSAADDLEVANMTGDLRRTNQYLHGYLDRDLMGMDAAMEAALAAEAAGPGAGGGGYGGVGADDWGVDELLAEEKFAELERAASGAMHAASRHGARLDEAEPKASSYSAAYDVDSKLAESKHGLAESKGGGRMGAGMGAGLSRSGPVTFSETADADERARASMNAVAMAEVKAERERFEAEMAGVERELGGGGEPATPGAATAGLGDPPSPPTYDDSYVAAVTEFEQELVMGGYTDGEGVDPAGDGMAVTDIEDDLPPPQYSAEPPQGHVEEGQSGGQEGPDEAAMLRSRVAQLEAMVEHLSTFVTAQDDLATDVRGMKVKHEENLETIALLQKEKSDVLAMLRGAPGGAAVQAERYASSVRAGKARGGGGGKGRAAQEDFGYSEGHNRQLSQKVRDSRVFKESKGQGFNIYGTQKDKKKKPSTVPKPFASMEMDVLLRRHSVDEMLTERAREEERQRARDKSREERARGDRTKLGTEAGVGGGDSRGPTFVRLCETHAETEAKKKEDRRRAEDEARKASVFKAKPYKAQIGDDWQTRKENEEVQRQARTSSRAASWKNKAAYPARMQTDIDQKNMRRSAEAGSKSGGAGQENAERPRSQSAPRFKPTLEPGTVDRTLKRRQEKFAKQMAEKKSMLRQSLKERETRAEEPGCVTRQREMEVKWEERRKAKEEREAQKKAAEESKQKRKYERAMNMKIPEKPRSTKAAQLKVEQVREARDKEAKEMAREAARDAARKKRLREVGKALQPIIDSTYNNAGGGSGGGDDGGGEPEETLKQRMRRQKRELEVKIKSTRPSLIQRLEVTSAREKARARALHAVATAVQDAGAYADEDWLNKAVNDDIFNDEEVALMGSGGGGGGGDGDYGDDDYA